MRLPRPSFPPRLAAAALAVALALATAPAARAAHAWLAAPPGDDGGAPPFAVEFIHVNDLATLTPHVDDLYTAALVLGVTRGPWRVELTENIFTDRERRLRFDETFLTGTRRLRGPLGLTVRVEAGALRVGEGLFGQPAQNFIHRLINDPELDLPYVPGTDYHAVLGVGVERPLEAGPALEVTPWADLRAAFGFKSRAAAGGAVHWAFGRRWWLAGRLGLRFTETDFAPLERWISDSAPEASASLGRGRWFRATYSFNAFGTSDHHWHVALTARWD